MFFGRLLQIFFLILSLLFKSSIKKKDGILKLNGPIRLRLFFEGAGGAFIKLGQILSLRQDFLPLSYINELLKLLNRLPPVSSDKIKSVFAEEKGVPPEVFFAEFCQEPIATASISQVYKAKLKGGDVVAVKIQKPKIKEIFEIDFKVMLFLAIVIDFFRLSSLFYAEEVVMEFISWTRKELDFTFEARNADIVCGHSLKHPRTVIPKQFLELSTKRVLIQEFIEDGIPVENFFLNKVSESTLLEKGVNVDEMANYLIADEMRQYFIDGFFHADPHPANLIFLPGNKLAYLDFGIVGRADVDRFVFLKNLHGIAKRDADLSAKFLMEFGEKIISRDIEKYLERETKNKKAIKDIFSKIKDFIFEDFKKEMNEILLPWFESLKNPNATLVEKSAAVVFFKTMKRAEKYNIHFPREMILFFRSLSILDMTALHISPKFDMIKALNYFFDKHPLEEIESIIADGSHSCDAGKKIIPTIDLDWESFRELVINEKEKTMIVREKTIEMILFYAEKYKEVRSMVKKIGK